MGACHSKKEVVLKEENISTPPPPPVEEASEEKVERFMQVHSAIRWKNFDEIQNIITTEEDFQILDPKTMNSPLHLATQNNRMDVVHFLISKGVNVNIQNKKGNTPMHMAVEFDYFPIFKALLDAGADPDLVNEDGVKASAGFQGQRSMHLFKLRHASSSQEIETSLIHCGDDIANLNIEEFHRIGQKLSSSSIWSPSFQAHFDSIVEKYHQFESSRSAHHVSPASKPQSHSPWALFCF